MVAYTRKTINNEFMTSREKSFSELALNVVYVPKFVNLNLNWNKDFWGHII